MGSENYSLISGDWNQIYNKLQENQVIHKYDVLLMSEVIYDVENYTKILDLIINLLGQGGYCLIASKVFYFGVGGSIAEFLEFAEKNYLNLFNFDIVN